MNRPDHVGDELGARLAHDASSWGGALSAAGRAALRARLLALPPRARRRGSRRLALAVACALVAALWAWARVRSVASPALAPPEAARHEATPPSTAVAAAAAGRALQPLRAELAGLTEDGRALARGIWTQVPAPLRGLVR